MKRDDGGNYETSEIGDGDGSGRDDRKMNDKGASMKSDESESEIGQGVDGETGASEMECRGNCEMNNEDSNNMIGKDGTKETGYEDDCVKDDADAGEIGERGGEEESNGVDYKTGNEVEAGAGDGNSMTGSKVDYKMNYRDECMGKPESKGAKQKEKHSGRIQVKSTNHEKGEGDDRRKDSREDGEGSSKDSSLWINDLNLYTHDYKCYTLCI